MHNKIQSNGVQLPCRNLKHWR